MEVRIDLGTRSGRDRFRTSRRSGKIKDPEEVRIDSRPSRGEDRFRTQER